MTTHFTTALTVPSRGDVSDSAGNALPIKLTWAKKGRSQPDLRKDGSSIQPRTIADPRRARLDAIPLSKTLGLVRARP